MIARHAAGAQRSAPMAPTSATGQRGAADLARRRRIGSGPDRGGGRATSCLVPCGLWWHAGVSRTACAVLETLATLPPDGAVRRAPCRLGNEAIRPHVAGDFATLLRAAVLHLMLHALIRTALPGEFGGGTARARRDLNENLRARGDGVCTALASPPIPTQADCSSVRKMAPSFAGG